ncbi:MAG: stage II sporulation protein M [Methanobrevibacter sp.]|nr:stage II sporulation protein M [Methanobrevibacter sp.]MEA4957836.1 stage II sporulation protein M [Methanobrevibacter sp.]
MLFLIPMFFGYFFAPYISGAMNPMVDSFRERVQQGDIQLTHNSIFFNNIYVGIILYCGAITFCLITASVLITNGVFIGYFATKMPLYSFLLLTLPHGIFEIPAIIIAGASGFVMFKFLVEFIKDIAYPKAISDEVKISVKHRITNSLNNNIDRLTQSLALLGFSAILLVIAAFIEAYLTISIANLFI